MTLSLPLASHLITALTILFLGIIVYFHDKKSFTNKVLFLHTLIITLWTIANYFSITTSESESLFWIRLVIFFAVPHVFLFFLFVLVFPERDFKVRPLLAFLYGLGILIAGAIALSPYGFSNIQMTGNLVKPVAGQLMPIFALIILGMSFWTVILLIKKYQKAENLQKKQYASIFTGLGVSYFLLISLVFLAVNLFGNTSFVPFSSFFILPMIVGSVYAILKHKLLRVKVITTELLTYAILVILLFRVLLAENVFDGVIGLFTLILFLPFGIFLIRSVLKEVEQREKLQKLTEDLNATNVKLTELDKLKSEFLNFASHQVKSPMVVVKGFAQLIYDGTYGNVPPEAKETALKIKQNADRTLALVNNLLDLGKIESGKMEFVFADVDIVAMARSMAEEYRVIGSAKGLEVQFESALASLKIRADEQKIRQVLQNIIDNSIKYTERGFVKMKIEEHGDYVVFTVSDSGQGLSEELQKKLFGRFVRDEKTKSEIKGTGLGLYIAKQIVDAHKGKIWAESDGEGKGSRFYVQLSKH